MEIPENRRKHFVKKILEEYAHEEVILQTYSEQYKKAYHAVYGASSRSNTHAQSGRGIVDDLKRAKEKLQRNHELIELGFMW